MLEASKILPKILPNVTMWVPHPCETFGKIFDRIFGVSNITHIVLLLSEPGNNAISEDEGTQSTQSVMCQLKTDAAIIDKSNNGREDYELPLFTLSSIQIATSYFSVANKIGEGGFGHAYKVTFDFHF